jgi:hypothetical protein
MAKQKSDDESKKKKYREVYLYDKRTGAYMGPHDATDGDPTATFTEDKPPFVQADDKTAVFRKGVWEVIAAKSLSEIAEALMKRDHRLQASDWTQLEDSQVDKAIWAEYRQKLRDLTAQAGFPSKIEWPEIPSTDKVEKKAEAVIPPVK